MKGDFSRLNLFDPLTRYTRVLQQQGRVQLDADWNEQGDILLHYLRTLARDLIGPFGTPDDGFGVGATGAGDAENLTVGAGRYYVDGLLCENRPADGATNVPYLGQPHPEPFPKSFPWLVYLDVWERHVTCHQDDAIREVALGGADTTSRAQVVWRVRTTPVSALTSDTTTLNKKTVWKGWEEWQKTWQSPDRGRLKAQAAQGGDDTDPCTASPEARYRGTENQLYRVEVQGWDADARALTFKWSRENGSVVFAIQDLQGDVATVASLGRDDASGLKEKDWVEIVDDDSELAGLPGALRQVKEIDPSRRTVTLVPAAWEPRPPVYTEEGEALAKHALLRRWDHRASPQPKGAGEPQPNGAALFVFPADATQETAWVTLESGIRVQFQRGSFRPGDYWLIPARTATGDVEWPGPPETPEALLPHGVEHHYAPLALVGQGTGGLNLQLDLRGSFAPLAK